jgi:hypothetical protein
VIKVSILENSVYRKVTACSHSGYEGTQAGTNTSVLKMAVLWVVVPCSLVEVY